MYWYLYIKLILCIESIYVDSSTGMKIMDVKTVCLGMLTDGPASGYDMKKCFESTFGHFFPAGYGSIYPALATLARNGMVEFELVPQEGKPDRKVYNITVKGREELLKGLANPKPTHKVRSEFLAMMCFAHLMTAEQIDQVLDNKLLELDAFLNLFSDCPSDQCGSMPIGAHFVAGFGHHIATSLRAYIEENRGMLTDSELKFVKAAVGS
jgi:DNA-binding PadR family transcriptional regulator